MKVIGTNVSSRLTNGKEQLRNCFNIFSTSNTPSDGTSSGGTAVLLANRSNSLDDENLCDTTFFQSSELADKLSRSAEQHEVSSSSSQPFINTCFPTKIKIQNHNVVHLDHNQFVEMTNNQATPQQQQIRSVSVMSNNSTGSCSTGLTENSGSSTCGSPLYVSMLSTSATANMNGHVLTPIPSSNSITSTTNNSGTLEDTDSDDQSDLNQIFEKLEESGEIFSLNERAFDDEELSTLMGNPSSPNDMMTGEGSNVTVINCEEPQQQQQQCNNLSCDNQRLLYEQPTTLRRLKRGNNGEHHQILMSGSLSGKDRGVILDRSRKIFRSMDINIDSRTPYSDATKTKKHKTNYVKRPMNAFMVYSQLERVKLIGSGFSHHNAVISKELGMRWKQLTPPQRQPYIDEAQRLKILHQMEYPDYKYKPKKKKKNKILNEDNNMSMMQVEQQPTELSTTSLYQISQCVDQDDVGIQMFRNFSPGQASDQSSQMGLMSEKNEGEDIYLNVLRLHHPDDVKLSNRSSDNSLAAIPTTTIVIPSSSSSQHVIGHSGLSSGQYNSIQSVASIGPSSLCLDRASSGYRTATSLNPNQYPLVTSIPSSTSTVIPLYALGDGSKEESAENGTKLLPRTTVIVRADSSSKMHQQPSSILFEDQQQRQPTTCIHYIPAAAFPTSTESQPPFMGGNTVRSYNKGKKMIVITPTSINKEERRQGHSVLLPTMGQTCLSPMMDPPLDHVSHIVCEDVTTTAPALMESVLINGDDTSKDVLMTSVANPLSYCPASDAGGMVDILTNNNVGGASNFNENDDLPTVNSSAIHQVVKTECDDEGKHEDLDSRFETPSPLMISSVYSMDSEVV